jgi:hypothetical protein
VARSARGAAALLALLVVVGCAGLRTRMEKAIERGDLELSFDRPADLLPPESLRVTSGQDRQIALAWDPVLVGDVAGYAITRARDAAGRYAVVGTTHSRFGNVFVDAGEGPGALGDGQTYHYRVHPHDSTGRVSRSHAYVVGTTDPPPAPPDGLQVYSNLPRRAVLRWNASPSASATGYEVLRSPVPAGPWERVGYVEGRVLTMFEDRVPGDLRVLYYRLRATNRFGGQSELTEIVRAVTKAEPLPPIGLAVERTALGQVALSWRPNVERDLVRYELVRASARDGGYGDEALVGEVAAAETATTDAGVGCGERVRYRLRARDDDGLQSEFSTPLEVQGDDVGLAVTTRPGGVELRWDPARAPGWERVRVFRRRALRPDEVVAEAEVASGVLSASLPAGAHELSAVFVRASVPAAESAGPGVGFGAAPAGARSPACRLALDIP